MTLVELLVALAVLGLMAALIFSNMGGWLSQSRASTREAAFWRSVTPAQIALSELTTGALDPSARRVASTEARFRTLAPRLSEVPIDAVLRIESQANQSRLMFFGAGIQSTMLTSPAPLRFKATVRNGILVEMQQGQQWRPIASGAFIANARPVCEFDLVSRDCR